MGAHPIDPIKLAAYHGYMITSYILALAVFVYAVFGIVRTAATRLPIPYDSVYDIMPVDITPRIYSFDRTGRKALKIAIFSLIGLGAGLLWGAILYGTYVAGDSWFLWSMNWGIWLTVGAHGLVLVGPTILFGIRARTHANHLRDIVPS